MRTHIPNEPKPGCERSNTIPHEKRHYPKSAEEPHPSAKHSKLFRCEGRDEI